MARYSEYKDSGVQWLGEIPRHWRCVPLKRVSSVNPQGRKMISDEEYVGYAPMDRIRCDKMMPTKILYSKLSTGLTYCEEGDIVLAKVTPCFENGNVAIVPEVEAGCCYASSELFVYRVKDIIQKRFLLYYFQNKGFIDAGASTMKGTGGLKRVSTEFAMNASLPLPPLSEQQAIVSYLDDKCANIDKMIEGKTKQIALLGEMKQRVIADTVTRGLNPDVKMKATNIPWLPEIPEHWEEKRLATQFTGDVLANKDFSYQHAFKFNYGQLVPKNEIGNPEEYRDVYCKYSIVEKGDVLINGLNLNYDFVSQRVACAPSDGIITSAYVVCRPRKGVNYNYYTNLFKAMDSQKLFHGMGTGIRLTLSFKELKKQLLPVPPLSEQRAIVDYINERTSKIDTLTAKLQQEIDAIKEYKQRIISDVVTGQIKVC